MQPAPSFRPYSRDTHHPPAVRPALAYRPRHPTLQPTLQPNPPCRPPRRAACPATPAAIRAVQHQPGCPS